MKCLNVIQTFKRPRDGVFQACWYCCNVLVLFKGVAHNTILESRAVGQLRSAQTLVTRVLVAILPYARL